MQFATPARVLEVLSAMRAEIEAPDLLGGQCSIGADGEVHSIFGGPPVRFFITSGGVGRHTANSGEFVETARAIRFALTENGEGLDNSFSRRVSLAAIDRAMEEVRAMVAV